MTAYFSSSVFRQLSCQAVFTVHIVTLICRDAEEPYFDFQMNILEVQRIFETT